MGNDVALNSPIISAKAGSTLEHALIARFGMLGQVPVPFLLRLSKLEASQRGSWCS